MDIFSFRSVSTFFLFVFLLQTVSCGRLGTEEDSVDSLLCISFKDEWSAKTKSSLSLPDTSDFILTVRSAKGAIVYEGPFGDCPESVSVAPGSYVVKVISREFALPAFDAPQFGDEQCVVVAAQGRTVVKLDCTQLNAGVSLDVSSDFLTHCPDASLFLKSSSGKLLYSYREKRTAYFPAGDVSLMMSSSGKDEILLTKELAPRDMLTIKVSVSVKSEQTGSVFRMSVDTSRVWHRDEYVIGGQSDEEEDVMTVAQARSSAEKEDVWVSGYIVGGDLTSSSASFSGPFQSRTNLLLGPKSSTVSRDACVSVQLPSGEVRDALNLVDNPDVLRKRVCIKGDVVSAYYGIPGIKNTVEFQFIN